MVIYWLDFVFQVLENRGYYFKTMICMVDHIFVAIVYKTIKCILSLETQKHGQYYNITGQDELCEDLISILIDWRVRLFVTETTTILSRHNSQYIYYTEFFAKKDYKRLSRYKETLF